MQYGRPAPANDGCGTVVVALSSEAARKRITELEAAMAKAIDCIETNLYHQREKVEDATAVLRSALYK